jgi:hypothetical protein
MSPQRTDMYHYHIDDDHQGADIEYTDPATRHPAHFHISAAQIDVMHAELHSNDQENT